MTISGADNAFAPHGRALARRLMVAPAEWALELCLTGDQRLAPTARAWFHRDGASRLLGLADLAHRDLYSPATEARDPFVLSTAAPLAFAIAYFSSQAGLSAAIADAALGRWLDAAPKMLALTVTPLRVTTYPVDEPGEAGCATSYHYVVRYYGPPHHAAPFAAAYERTHPPLLARLPRIRGIACFHPIAEIAAPGRTAADYLIGNEVEFDSAADFETAMASPARALLRADFEALPPLFRDNTHFEMRRERRFPQARAVASVTAIQE
uniref:EthD domain-containing protein n=1 Tax=Rhodopseudomonas palustris (strain BisA53) TaxID=316055 RepID=Q07LM8_RHOP5